MLHRR